MGSPGFASQSLSVHVCVHRCACDPDWLRLGMDCGMKTLLDGVSLSFSLSLSEEISKFLKIAKKEIYGQPKGFQCFRVCSGGSAKLSTDTFRMVFGSKPINEDISGLMWSRIGCEIGAHARQELWLIRGCFVTQNRFCWLGSGIRAISGKEFCVSNYLILSYKFYK